MKSGKVCVDASLALVWLIDDQRTAYADDLRRHWRRQGIHMVGPAMFFAEVTSVLRKQVFFGRFPREKAERALSITLRMPVQVLDSPEVYRRAWELAKSYNLPSTYDMQYLAVAELEDCEFWTGDTRLVNSLGGKNHRVRVVGENLVNT